MATPSPIPANHSDLPMLPVSVRALTQFNATMDRQLAEMVRRFGGRDRELRIDSRHAWKAPRPNKPR
jgi:hypothetical protein